MSSVTESVVEKLSAKRPAVIYQSTAYGQSGREQLAKTFAELKLAPVLEESVAPTVNDLTPALLRAKAANADVIVLHLHAPSTVLAVRQARQLLQQTPRPRRYVGIDINREMVEWCRANLSPVDRNFQFHHHDVYSPTYGAHNTLRLAEPFPVEDHAFVQPTSWLDEYRRVFKLFEAHVK